MSEANLVSSWTPEGEAKPDEDAVIAAISTVYDPEIPVNIYELGLIYAVDLHDDGKVRAHDEETGKILWTGTLPAGSEGVPAMYEVNGRQYLVVPASSRINTGGGHVRPGDAPIEPAAGARSYVAFALPRK